MDDIILTFNARKTILEMINDRGYDIPKEYLNIDIETFRYLFNNKNCDIICNHKTFPKKKVYVKFIQIQRIRPTVVRENAKQIIKNYLNSEDSELIFVLKINPNNSIKKISKEQQFSISEFFWINDLQFNITKHKIQPKFILCSKGETDALMDKYTLKSLQQLPHFTKDDPIVKYYNYNSGSVIKMIRYSKTSITYAYYRYVK